MYSQLFYELLALSAAGFGMLALGVSHLVLKHASGWVRFVSNATIVGGSVGVATLVAEPKQVLWAAGLLAGTWVLLSASLWSGCSLATAWLMRQMRQPLLQGGATVGLGVLLIGYAVAKFERDDNAMLDGHMAYLETLSARPTLTNVSHLAKTDGGRELGLGLAEAVRTGETITSAETKVLAEMQYANKVIRLHPADDTSNCHGWVFTGGKYWVDGAEVPAILEANGYQVVTEPKPGDVAIYHDGELVTHTALVRFAGEGRLAMVESKWGWMGVYLHRVDQSVYGQNFTYYRSPRDGHLLAGLGGPTTTDTPLLSGTTELHDTTDE